MDQNLALHQAQMGILRLLGRLKNVEQVNELRQIISNYYHFDVLKTIDFPQILVLKLHEFLKTLIEKELL